MSITYYTFIRYYCIDISIIPPYYVHNIIGAQKVTRRRTDASDCVVYYDDDEQILDYFSISFSDYRRRLNQYYYYYDIIQYRYYTTRYACKNELCEPRFKSQSRILLLYKIYNCGWRIRNKYTYILFYFFLHLSHLEIRVKLFIIGDFYRLQHIIAGSPIFIFYLFVEFGYDVYRFDIMKLVYNNLRYFVDIYVELIKLLRHVSMVLFAVPSIAFYIQIEPNKPMQINAIIKSNIIV